MSNLADITLDPVPLSYASAADDADFNSSRTLLVRLWWMAVIWSGGFVGFMAVNWLEMVLTDTPRENLWWLIPELGATLGALGLLVLLLARRCRFDWATVVAARITLVCLVMWFVPYWMQVWEQRQLRGTTYAILVSIEGLGIYAGWWMALVGLVLASALRRPSSRLRGILHSPQQFAIALALLAAIALATREVARIGYIATDPTGGFLEAIRRPAWFTIAVRAALLVVAAGMLGGALYKARATGAANRAVVIAAICVILLTMGISAVNMRLANRLSPGANRFEWTLRFANDLIWHFMNFAALLPALTWPARTGVVAPAPIG